MFKFQHRQLEGREEIKELIRQKKLEKEQKKIKELFPNGVKYGGEIFEVIRYIESDNKSWTNNLLIRNDYKQYWVIDLFCIIL